VALITLGGAVGVTAGFGASLLAEVESDRTMFAIAGAGSLAGLWGAWRMTRDMEAEMR
jgi:hypothetical protein